jgi:hypothetical protein
MPIPTYHYDPAARRYSTDKGRILSQKEIRQALDTVLEKSASRMEKLTKDFVSTKDFPQWAASMVDEIRVVNTQAFALANGGIKNLSQSDLGRLGNQTKEQLKTFRELYLDLKNDRKPIDGRLPQWAKLYATTRTFDYENERVKGDKESGMLEGMRVLGGSKEPCGTCPPKADKWLPIEHEDLVLGGDECSVGCNCSILTR